MEQTVEQDMDFYAFVLLKRAFFDSYFSPISFINPQLTLLRSLRCLLFSFIMHIKYV